VLAVQEFQAPQRKVFENHLGKNYGIYPSQPHYNYGKHVINSVNSLVYDKDQVKLLARKSLPMIYFNGRRMNIPLAKFKIVGTNQVFEVAGTHDPAHPPFAKYRMIDAKLHAKNFNAIKGPRILLGDLNQKNTLMHSGNITYGNTLKNNSICILEHEAGLVDAAAAARDMKACSPKGRRRLGSGTVDHGLVSPNIEVSHYRVINKGRTHSDHHLVMFDAKIPMKRHQHHRNRR
jgi:endonuclease/exonuclease/phosphatase family metal-dependent hydrolase